MMSELTVERADLGMAWAVKDSFVRYVQSMRDGRILLRDGAAVTNTRQFYFPFKNLDQADGDSFVLQFGGEAHFLAHHGLMSVAICNPKIEVGPDGAYLSIKQGNEAVRLADLRLPAVSMEDGVNMWADIQVALTGQGAAVFADSYSAGEILAPLTMRAPSVVKVP
ncbi:HtaA domain-containing protein [Arthrobacter sp. TES]|nr:HtaA domain-containing protein [Arthrobacter sp. TES]